MSTPRWLAGAALVLAPACASIFQPPPPPPLATSHWASDFDSYDLRRIGLLPFRGAGVDETRAKELQHAFRFELARSAPYEVVLLAESDLAEIDPSRPHERGAYSTRGIVDTARRFRLDGLLVGTVTHLESYAPQAVGLELELVAAETGRVVWSSSLDADTADAGVRRSIESYQARRRDESGEPADIDVVLLSPSQLMRFAAAEVARTVTVPVQPR